MGLYMRFISSLAVGLIGLGFVLKTVIDELFNEWDAPAAFSEWLRHAMSGKGLRGHERAEDLLLEIEKAKTSQVSMRMIDKRREQLKELASVERRLQMPGTSGPVVLTPLPPPQRLSS